MNKLLAIEHFSLFICIILASSLIVYIFLSNLAPMGVSVDYSVSEKSVTLGPSERVTQLDDLTYKQVHDLVYFTIPMPFKFDKANVQVIYKNQHEDQVMYLGYQDQGNSHFATTLIDASLLNALGWSKVGTNPTLFQREKIYTSSEEFLKNPPKDRIIGLYNYGNDIFNSKLISIPDYKPSTIPTKITTPLRGRHVLYMYLNNEKFQMTVTKQDLNYYSGGDPMRIKVLKDNENLYEQIIDDDGITDNSHTIQPEQQLAFENPRPELPESGVYKVIIEANNDTLIKSIETNLHKIVFAESIFPASNQVYKNIILETQENIIYSNAVLLSAKTYHNEALQDILVDDEKVQLVYTHQSITTSSASMLKKIVLPKSDVILNGTLGYFAMSEEQFFNPSPFLTVPIKYDFQTNAVDIILANYTPPNKEGEWYVSQTTFDLSNAYITNGKLNWIIKVPGLLHNNKSISIKDIHITMQKKPLNFFTQKDL